MIKERIHWIDTTKGFAMILVVYCHNFPLINDYIYSFHVPLFFLVSGMFHPKTTKVSIVGNIKKRCSQIMIPYFLWASLLFIFWVFVGRNFGKSADLNLSIFNNAIGVLSGQGGREYMDWGIPLWFLPCIFVVFIVYSMIKLLKNVLLQRLVVLSLLFLGYVLSFLFEWYIWSFDVALVALLFYALGNELKSLLIQKQIPYYLFVLVGIVHFILHIFLGKVDMYRSSYGSNFLLFVVTAVFGSIFFMILFQKLPRIKVLEFVGKHTIVYLALQGRVLTVIKGFLMIVFGITVFTFSELEKGAVTAVQLILLLPIAYLIEKYIPILNGKGKRI